MSFELYLFSGSDHTLRSLILNVRQICWLSFIFWNITSVFAIVIVHVSCVSTLSGLSIGELTKIDHWQNSFWSGKHDKLSLWTITFARTDMLIDQVWGNKKLRMVDLIESWQEKLQRQWTPLLRLFPVWARTMIFRVAIFKEKRVRACSLLLYKRPVVAQDHVHRYNVLYAVTERNELLCLCWMLPRRERTSSICAWWCGVWWNLAMMLLDYCAISRVKIEGVECRDEQCLLEG